MTRGGAARRGVRGVVPGGRRRNLLYAQSGGATAVLNASASAVILAARQVRDARPARVGRILAARDGLIGMLAGELFDTDHEARAQVAALAHTPGAAFGTCRKLIDSGPSGRAQIRALLAMFRERDIGMFVLSGGNGSMDTALRLSEAAREAGEPLACVGVPKTIDNDILGTDCSPGFGSAAKYVATAVRELGLEVASIAASSTRVFVLEVMGRHTGWLAASAGMAGGPGEAPHIVLVPERPFDQRAFLARVRAVLARHGHCVVAAAEGIVRRDGRLLATHGRGRQGGLDERLGGVGPMLAALVQRELGVRARSAVPDYLQRAASHLASATDLAHATAAGAHAARLAIAGRGGVMVAIQRLSNAPYRWRLSERALSRVSGLERRLPAGFLTADGHAITATARRYFSPLIAGEAAAPWSGGLPVHARLRNLAA